MNHTSESFFMNHEQKVLELESRKKIYQYVCKYAGSHFRELERLSGFSVGVLRHHLDALVKHDLIVELKEGTNVRYSPRELSSHNAELLGLLRQSSIRKIIVCLLIHDPSDYTQFEYVVHLSPSTIAWHLKKLQEKNVISKVSGRRGEYTLVTDKKEIITLLITYKESFVDSLVDRVVEMWDI